MMISRKIAVLSGLLALILIPATAGAFTPGPMAEKIEQAFVDKAPYPLATQTFSDLTEDQAYRIQEALVQIRKDKGETVMGYKAGLTAAAVQQQFGLDHAVWGVLTTSMFRWPGTVYRRQFARMFIETEIGYRFGKAITSPVTDMATLKESVAIVFPAIELPDIAFSDMKQLKGLDVIATNVTVRNVLVGQAQPKGKFDLNAVQVALSYNGEKIADGEGRNALGDQWEALKWTVNSVISRGGKIQSGDVIITGSMTPLKPGNLGTYTADYGPFGKIVFECK